MNETISSDTLRLNGFAAIGLARAAAENDGFMATTLGSVHGIWQSHFEILQGAILHPIPSRA